VSADLAPDLALCALIAITALASVAGHGLFRALAFFIAYGLLVALGWVRLGAVDVALAEAAIGAGRTGVLLLGAYGALARAGAETAPPTRSPSGVHWPALAAALGVAGLLLWAWGALPPAPGPAPQIVAALPQAGVGNPVTAVLLNFRAWDTLLESVVLLIALVGLWLRCPDAAWPGRPGAAQRAAPGGVLATLGHTLPPAAALVGAYLVYAGADRPGGAFQGGTVIAAALLVAVLGGAWRPPPVSARRWRLVLVAGPATFLAAGALGLGLGHGFLGFPPALAGTAILVIEVALAASIAVTLAFLVLGPPEAER
jgi:multisubunit Na+/H+ antiporter MnhB subunit